MTKPLKVVSLFDGISSGYLALQNLNIPVLSYKASEVNKYSIEVSKTNFPNIDHIGDVTNVHIHEGQCDLLIAGSPCQGLSLAGKQKGFDDNRSVLFFEFVRILKECKPVYFFLENNKMNKVCSDLITKTLNVEPILIDAALLSTQHRERLYWTNIPNRGIPTDKKICLQTIIGSYEGIWVYPRGFNKGGVRNYKNKCPTITSSCWENNFFIVKNGTKVKFTPELLEEIQGLPIGYTSAVPKSQRYKLIGNSWSIPVIEYLFNNLRQVRVKP